MRMQRNLADKTLPSQVNTPQPLGKNNSVSSVGLLEDIQCPFPGFLLCLPLAFSLALLLLKKEG